MRSGNNYRLHLLHLNPTSSEVDSLKSQTALYTMRSSDWLNALPSRTLCLNLSDAHFRVAVGLRLGAPVCSTHTCVCDSEADKNGQHALACAIS